MRVFQYNTKKKKKEKEIMDASFIQETIHISKAPTRTVEAIKIETPLEDIVLTESNERNTMDIDIEEMRVRAFMRMLRVGEGTTGEKGYETLFGGKSFIKDFNKTFTDHPRIPMPYGTRFSTAAGAYQVMGYTWDDAHMIAQRARYSITTFTPRDQDLFCLVLLKEKREEAWPLLLAGEIEASLTLNPGGYSYEWASLPPGRYGQPIKSMQEALDYYHEYLQEEILGKSDLHLETGFLKKFLDTQTT